MSALFCAPDLEVLTESSKNRDSSASAVDEPNRAASTKCSAIAFVVSRTLQTCRMHASMLQGNCSTARTKGFQPISRGLTLPLPLERQGCRGFAVEQGCRTHACDD
ncbi:hypothetical protein SDC9_126766 [bioreactor metagenome]|uniref:Uncharacterized protein n=1 Tax=bioreactor metagenome TaxID=1076179 RepID=A0A645CRL1_9ZZZZ